MLRNEYYLFYDQAGGDHRICNDLYGYRWPAGNLLEALRKISNLNRAEGIINIMPGPRSQSEVGAVLRMDQRNVNIVLHRALSKMREKLLT